RGDAGVVRREGEDGVRLAEGDLDRRRPAAAHEALEEAVVVAALVAALGRRVDRPALLVERERLEVARRAGRVEVDDARAREEVRGRAPVEAAAEGAERRERGIAGTRVPAEERR